LFSTPLYELRASTRQQRVYFFTHFIEILKLTSFEPYHHHTVITRPRSPECKFVNEKSLHLSLIWVFFKWKYFSDTMRTRSLKTVSHRKFFCVIFVRNLRIYALLKVSDQSGEIPWGVSTFSNNTQHNQWTWKWGPRHRPYQLRANFRLLTHNRNKLYWIFSYFVLILHYQSYNEFIISFVYTKMLLVASAELPPSSTFSILALESSIYNLVCFWHSSRIHLIQK
jgi:hypothetical protein